MELSTLLAKAASKVFDLYGCVSTVEFTVLPDMVELESVYGSCGMSGAHRDPAVVEFFAEELQAVGTKIARCRAVDS